jgi:hypothetical protein
MLSSPIRARPAPLLKEVLMLEEIEQITVTVADIEALATKLEGIELLDPQEHATLAGVFMLAGQAVSYRADDVSGFSLNFTKGTNQAIDFCRPGELVPAVKGGGLINGFSWGLHGTGGGGGAGFPTDQ